MLRALASLVALAVTAAALVWLHGRTALNVVLPPGDFVVEHGTAWDRLADRMASRGGLDPLQLAWLRLHGRLDPTARKIQAGEYLIADGDTVATLIGRMVAGDVRQYALTLIEGWRFVEALAAIRGHPRIRQTLPDDPSRIMAALGAPDLHPEGRFLPETYHFPAGTSDLQVLRRAFEAMREALAAAWAARSSDLPLASPDELLTLASIIERETALDEERALIAGVFVNRLRRGMRLQTDPTVIYGLGDRFDGNLRRRDLRTDTPYNTYTRHGLPPTPICLPSRASLMAAAQPAQTEYLYFVSRGDGSHEFSATLAEHNRAVRRYQLGRGS